MTIAITPRQRLFHEELPMRIDPGAISLAPDGQERTRTDLITYATQFLSASLVAGEILFKKLSMVLVEKNSSLETIPKACESSKEQFLMSMTEMMRKLSHNPRLIGFAQEDAILYESLTTKLQRLKKEPFQDDGEISVCTREIRRISEKISASLAEPLIYSKKLKAELIQTKEEIISLSKAAARHFQESCEALLSNPLFQFLTFEERSSLLEVQKGAFQIEMNKERSRILLASKEWRRDVPTDFPYFIRDRLNEAVQGHFISSFQAAGPAYCSQLPRKRIPDRTTLINFFFSSFKDRENSPLKLDMCVTRSGVIAESNQENKLLRYRCTQKNIQQLAQTHAEQALERMSRSPEVRMKGQGTVGDPYQLPLTLITLLTPDFYVHLRALFGKTPQADDGRLHLNELCHIYEEYKKHPLLVNAGQKYFKIDFRYVNIPSKNDYDERRKSRFFQCLVSHTHSDKILRDTIQKLLVDAKEYQSLLLDRKQTFVSVAEREILSSLTAQIRQKEKIRHQLSCFILRTKSAPSKDQVESWKTISDALVKNFDDELQKEEISPAFKSALAQSLKSSLIQDLMSDLQELTFTRLYKDVEKMQGNRFGFAARILLLTGLMSQGGHFSCNSGKDRTGLLDDELKLLLAETSEAERLPSWFEQIGWRHHRLNRKNVLEQAGNALFIPKANIGNVAWLNLRGNRPVLSSGVNLEEKQEERELNASYDHIEAASMITMKVELSSKDIIF